jgi:hypothetical protein
MFGGAFGRKASGKNGGDPMVAPLYGEETDFVELQGYAVISPGAPDEAAESRDSLATQQRPLPSRLA